MRGEPLCSCQGIRTDPNWLGSKHACVAPVCAYMCSCVCVYVLFVQILLLREGSLQVNECVAQRTGVDDFANIKKTNILL